MGDPPRYPNLEEDGSRSTFFLELTKEFNYSLAEKLALQLKVKSDKILSLKNKYKEDAPLFACHLLNAWYDNVTLDNTDSCKQLAAALLKIGHPVEAKKVDPEIKVDLSNTGPETRLRKRKSDENEHSAQQEDQPLPKKSKPFEKDNSLKLVLPIKNKQDTTKGRQINKKSVLCYCEKEVEGIQVNKPGPDKGRIKYWCEKCHYSQWQENISMKYFCFHGINVVSTKPGDKDFKCPHVRKKCGYNKRSSTPPNQMKLSFLQKDV